jgi:hypothetical protein
MALVCGRDICAKSSNDKKHKGKKEKEEERAEVASITNSLSW